MAAISAPFHGLSTKLYADTIAIVPATATTTEEVGNVSSIGQVQLTANIIEYNSYGLAYKKKLVGQKDSGTLDITLNWVPDAVTEPNQDLLRQYYASGAKLFFGIKWVDSLGNLAWATFSGFVASFAIDQPVEDVVTANVQIAIDGAVTLDTDGTP